MDARSISGIGMQNDGAAQSKVCMRKEWMRKLSREIEGRIKVGEK